MSKGYMFIDMRWELALRMHPNNYAYVQRALAELCVDLADQDVLDGWAIKCPHSVFNNLLDEVENKQDGMTIRSVSKDELLAAEGSG